MSERQPGGRDPANAGDAWLRVAVRAALPESADLCPDVSEVAAFAEGRLDPAERERFEQHVASCTRCLDLLGTLAQADEPAVSAAGEPARGRGAWWRWLVPATVAATAAGLYLLVQPAPPAMPTGTAEPPAHTVVADSRLNERAEQAPGRAAMRDAQRPPATAAAPQPRPAPAAGPRPPAAPAPAASRPTGTAAAPARAKDAEPAARQEAFAPVPVVADQALEVPSKGVAVSAEAGARAATPAERERGKTEPGPVVQAESRAVPQAAARAAPTRDVAPEDRALGATAAAHWLEVSVPDGSSRWRFGPGAAVSRSADGGRTWEPGTTPAGVSAASCPAPSTCWAVGRAGVVIATSDGLTWRRIPFPDSADLVDVAAESATVATVSAAAGTRYTTRDGGATWVAVEPR